VLSPNRVVDAVKEQWEFLPRTPPTALLIDSGADDVERTVLPMLFTTLTAPTSNEALIHIRRSAPELLVVPLKAGDGEACALCRAAKDGLSPPAILVLAEDVAVVPAAITAGCDSILIRPFAPNLLFTRLARLFPRTLPQDGPATSRFTPTNQRWNSPCPSCGRRGVVSVDAASLRQWWFACTACSHVWASDLPAPSAGTNGSRRHYSCSIGGMVAQDDKPPPPITTTGC